jgi:DnaK suppressor protein
MDPKSAKRALLQLKRQLTDLDEKEAESLAVSLEEEAGDEAYDQHSADVGTVTLTREIDLSLQENTERLLAQVNRALEKIEEGTYGVCDRGGEPIEEGRLKAMPYATLCMKHQVELERSQGIR